MPKKITPINLGDSQKSVAKVFLLVTWEVFLKQWNLIQIAFLFFFAQGIPSYTSTGELWEEKSNFLTFANLRGKYEESCSFGLHYFYDVWCQTVFYMFKSQLYILFCELFVPFLSCLFIEHWPIYYSFIKLAAIFQWWD